MHMRLCGDGGGSAEQQQHVDSQSKRWSSLRIHERTSHVTTLHDTGQHTISCCKHAPTSTASSWPGGTSAALLAFAMARTLRGAAEGALRAEPSFAADAGTLATAVCACFACTRAKATVSGANPCTWNCVHKQHQKKLHAWMCV